MATIKDVAHAANVSTATVSAVVNDSAYVSPPLRERVLAAIKALDYLPSGVARNLKRGRSQLIALVCADLSNPFFSLIVCTAEAAVSEWGYGLVVFNSDEKPERERQIFSRIRELGCDGAILAPVAVQSEYLTREYTLSPFPLVLLDRAVEGLDADSVTIDNHASAAMAINYLLDLGHTKIGSVTGPLHISTGIGRYEGVIDAMKARNLTPNPAYFRSGEFRENEAYSAAAAMLRAPDRPTALYVANGPMTLGVLRAIADLGLRCPADVSVIATDNVNTGTGGQRPFISHTSQPVDGMADTAVRLLMERIRKGKDAPEARHIAFEPSLIVRDSCAPVRG